MSGLSTVAISLLVSRLLPFRKRHRFISRAYTTADKCII
jgi:hypothetical protein